MTKREVIEALKPYKADDTVLMFPHTLLGVDEDGNDVTTYPALMVFSNDELTLLGECDVIQLDDAGDSEYTA